MKYIIGILIVLDVAFQLLAEPNDIMWGFVHNMTHYGFMLAVCLYFIYDKLIFFFTVYFLSIIITLIYQFAFNISTYTIDPVYSWAGLILILLSTFSIHKLCLKK